MKIKMSSNIAVRTNRVQEALKFYTEVLGFNNRSDDPDFGDFEASPLTVYVDQDHELSGVVLELMVEDLDQAREELVRNGCEVIRWRGKGQDCYLRDPFGVIYNIWEG